MDAPHSSFFLDAMADEAESVLVSGGQSPEPCDTSMTQLSTVDIGGGSTIDSDNLTSAPTDKTDGSPGFHDAPQATLLFVVGGKYVSDSYELSALSEHPDALNTITSHPCLGTSSFLASALQAAMAELRPSLMLQVAVRLTTISLRLIGEILPSKDVSAQPNGLGEGQMHELIKTVRRELDCALPFYQWQGSRHHCGQVQYLAALLEEAIHVFGVSKYALRDALRLDLAASHAAERVVRSIQDLGQDPNDVCGAWAAEVLLPASAMGTMAGVRDPIEAVSEEYTDAQGRRPSTTPGKPDAGHFCQTPQSLTPDSSREDSPSASHSESDKLPPHSKLSIRKPCKSAYGPSRSAGEIRNEATGRGSGTDHPMCISDSDSDAEPPLPSKLSSKQVPQNVSQYSCHGRPVKVVNYNTRHHPQDDDLPATPRRRKATRSAPDKGVDPASLVKRCKTGASAAMSLAV